MMFFFFFKQKTAYEMRISDWSSDVCSSDLYDLRAALRHRCADRRRGHSGGGPCGDARTPPPGDDHRGRGGAGRSCDGALGRLLARNLWRGRGAAAVDRLVRASRASRSEEHTSELQSLMRNSFAVYCLKQKINSISI